LDVKKLPLGKLSKTQITKGFTVLEQIEDAIKKNNRHTLSELASQFYTVIPHSFGRRVPPIIGDAETLRQKLDMLAVLSDIEIAQTLTKKKGSDSKKEVKIENPLDNNYNLLNCDINPLEKKSEEYKAILNYLRATEGSYRKLKLVDVFEISRHKEEKRFAAHDHITNRKLLWHGTNVAVVVAILSSGLRIMPHSGGRVGKGIYFASENSKSAGYVGCAGNTGIMFLSEVALGKEHHITSDDSSLEAPPPGYDSIIAKGHTEPDPKKDTIIKIEGKDVVVPQGNPVTVKKFSGSSFSQSEYLIYKESQNRIRYLLRLEFN